MITSITTTKLARVLAGTAASLLISFVSCMPTSAMVGAQLSWDKLYEQATADMEQQQYDKAEADLWTALARADADATKQYCTLTVLAELYDLRQQFAAEQQVLLRTLDVIVTHRTLASLSGEVYMNLAATSAMMNKMEEARDYNLKAIPLLKTTFGDKALVVGVALNNLGWLECKTGQQSAGLAHLRESANVIGAAEGLLSAPYGMIANNLALALIKGGYKSEALLWYQRASNALKASLGPDNPMTREVGHAYVQLHYDQGHNRKLISRKHKPAAFTQEQRNIVNGDSQNYLVDSNAPYGC